MAKTCGNGCRYGVFSKGLCKSCWQREYGKPINKNPNAKPLKRTPLKKATKPINKVSEKRKQEQQEYAVLVKKFLLEHKFCEARVKCKENTKSEDCHHKKGRSENLFLDTTHWLAVCRKCHDWITENSAKAIELGLSESRNKV